MQAKKKKKKTIIIRTTQPRAVRLQGAKAWLAGYEGKNLVRGYAKKYRTGLLGAIEDLKLLGVEIKPAYEQAVRKAIAQTMEQNQRKKGVETAGAEGGGISQYQDSDFAFIAGYTSGGVPYGVRWEEMDGALGEE